MGRLFGTDGIRGVAGKELNIDLAVKCGRALGTVLSGNERPRIIIASDTRISKDMLSAALGAGLMSVGVDVAYIGCISTPAVAYLVRRHSLSGGIQRALPAYEEPPVLPGGSFCFCSIKIPGEGEPR